MEFEGIKRKQEVNESLRDGNVRTGWTYVGEMRLKYKSGRSIIVYSRYGSFGSWEGKGEKDS